jgi:anaerobic selenocysteine-containing dehydrogenase
MISSTPQSRDKWSLSWHRRRPTRGVFVNPRDTEGLGFNNGDMVDLLTH